MRVLITGATNGMGKGVAHALALHDDQRHEIVVHGRSKGACEATVQELRSATGNQRLSYVVGDLTSLAAVRRMVDELRARYDSLDAIFINAGLGYAARRQETEDAMDPHFQVNYLSQFMLTLGLLELLARSESGGRVIFNATRGGEIFWDDLQMTKKWGYEDGVHQAMVAKRMFSSRLHALHRRVEGSKTAFVCFEIQKTVWSNQLEIIPWPMRAMATVMKWFGSFISIERCGEIMAPLFTEAQAESLKKSGRFFTGGDDGFVEIAEEKAVLDPEAQARLWDLSLGLVRDEEIARRAAALCRAA
jgi:hypothetical protein